MSKNASSSTRRESNAVKFVKGGANKSASDQPAGPELQLVSEDVEQPDPPVEAPKNSEKPKKASKPELARSELPKKELSHRVRIDIHSRIDDEAYRRKKMGERTPLADIADEALHLGLLQIEKRGRQSKKS